MSSSTRPYVATNLVGMLCYVFVVWRIDQNIAAERRDYADFGDSLRFFTICVPILLGCLIYSAVTAVRSLRRRDAHELKSVGAVLVAWFAVFAIFRFI